MVTFYAPLYLGPLPCSEEEWASLIEAGQFVPVSTEEEFEYALLERGYEEDVRNGRAFEVPVAYYKGPRWWE